MRQIEQLRALSGAERRVLLRAVVWLPVASVLLRLLGFRQTRAFFARRQTVARSSLSTECIQRARSTARMIRVAASHGPFRARCLEQSLVLTRFLGAENIPCTLVLGAGRESEEFRAHAWVESGGVVVSDGENVELRYTPFRPPADR